MTRALVFSGGGPVGIAWETGIAVGLARGHVDLTLADLIVGTSAGSVVGANIALGRDMDQTLHAFSESAEQTTTTDMPEAATLRGAADEGLAGLFAVLAGAASGDRTDEESRAIIGKFALEAKTFPEEAFLGFFEDFDGESWPRRFKCTAVDANTGEFVAWDGTAGEPLQRAIGSSCAVPGVFPPITVNGRRYVDGGMRSIANADLAVGHDTVLIVSLSAELPPEMAALIDPSLADYLNAGAREIEALGAAGATVRVISPTAEFTSYVGMNLMNMSLAPKAGEMGVVQGEQLAEELRGFWG
jgi:NTE family protein